MRGLSVTVGGFVACAAALGCSSEDDAGRGPGAPSGPTYHADVAPILQRSCQACHAPGEIAPFSLLTYEEARSVAALMVTETAARTMPPWGAIESDECRPRHGWKNDIRLTDEEIATIAAWSDAGAPEGNPADAPPPVETISTTLPGATHELTSKAPHVTSGSTDEFRCFVMDPGLTETLYLNGAHVIPGNAKVVHHAVVVADPGRESAAMAGPDGSYECFGDFGFSPDLLHIWTPGALPFEVPPTIGLPVTAGSLVVVQIHYHPAGTTADPDTTRLQLRFSPDKPEYFLAPATEIGNFNGPEGGNGDGLLRGPNDLPGGPEFRIPANVADHVERMRITVPSGNPDIWVYGAAAHMHYVGTDLKIELEQVGERQCLLHEPRWDFNWQRTYAYDAPIEELPVLRAGNRVHVSCKYDNTMGNPFVARALAEANLPSPEDVFLGEQTLDEMCLALLPLIYKAP